MIVKDLLLEALSRANHMEDGAPVEGRELAKARKHFRSSLAVYSDSNLITAFQRVVTVKGKEEQTLGKYNMKRGKTMHFAETYEGLPDPAKLTPGKDFGQYVDAEGKLEFARVGQYYGEDPVWIPSSVSGTPEERLRSLDCCDYVPDVIVIDMERVSAAMYKHPDSEAWDKLDFTPLSSFYTEDSFEIYCAVPRGDGKTKLFLPKELVGLDVRLVYTTSMKFKDSDYLELPEVYKELLTLAVTVGLLSEDDDSDPKQLDKYTVMLTDLKHQVMANNANTRRITRSGTDSGLSDLHSGRFISRRLYR